MVRRKGHLTQEQIEELEEQEIAKARAREKELLARKFSIRAKRVITYPENKRAALRHAKLLYFMYHQPGDIQAFLEIPQDNFKYHLYKKKTNWKTEREKNGANIFKDAQRTMISEDYEEIVGLSIQVLKRGLQAILAREDEVGVKELKLISDVTANYHRMKQVEKGEPSDIKRYESMTPEQIKEETRKILQEVQDEDPLSQYHLC